MKDAYIADPHWGWVCSHCLPEEAYFISLLYIQQTILPEKERSINTNFTVLKFVEENLPKEPPEFAFWKV